MFIGEIPMFDRLSPCALLIVNQHSLNQLDTIRNWVSLLSLIIESSLLLPMITTSIIGWVKVIGDTWTTVIIISNI